MPAYPLSCYDPSWLSEVTKGYWSAMPNGPIKGFSYDTRLLEPGYCFIALKTHQADGHDFLVQAQAQLASAAIVHHINSGVHIPQLVVQDTWQALRAIAKAWRKQLHIPIIGITGSCGKTSTKDLIHHLLGNQGIFKSEGNFNNTLGVPLMLTKIDPTLHHIAVLEAGINQPGEMAILADCISPHIGVLTNIEPVHLERLQSLDGIAQEKSALLQAIPSDGLAFLPLSLQRYPVLNTLKCSVQWVQMVDDFSLAHLPSSIRYKTQLIDHQILIQIDWYDEIFSFQSSYYGPGMLQNIILALCVALSLNISPELLNQRLKTWEPSALRSQWINKPYQCIFADCYNANPTAMREAFVVFQRLASPHQPFLYIIGSMNELGSQAQAYHVQTASYLRLRSQDRACLIGPYAKDLAKGLIQAGATEDQIIIATHIQEIEPIMRSFQGCIFLKGSRSFQLDQLL